MPTEVVGPFGFGKVENRSKNVARTSGLERLEPLRSFTNCGKGHLRVRVYWPSHIGQECTMVRGCGGARRLCFLFFLRFFASGALFLWCLSATRSVSVHNADEDPHYVLYLPRNFWLLLLGGELLATRLRLRF